MSPRRRLYATTFWVAVIFAYIAAVLPPDEAPIISKWDKLNHMIAFFVATLLGRMGYRRMPAWLLGLSMAVFGAAIELSQALPFIHRDAEWNDWFADLAAIALALAVAWVLMTLGVWWRKRRPISRTTGGA